VLDPPGSSPTIGGFRKGSLYQTLPVLSKVIRCEGLVTAVSAIVIVVVTEEKCPTLFALFSENQTTSFVES